MGAIVSTKEDITDNDCASPSAVTAAQAKIRFVSSKLLARQFCHIVTCLYCTE